MLDGSAASNQNPPAPGSTQAQLLTRASVGRLVLVDRDVLELNNLP